MLRKILVSAGVLFLWLAPHVHADVTTHRGVPFVPTMYAQAACPSDAALGGCAYSSEARTYCKPGTGPVCFWHEHGHVYDAFVLTDAHRAEFMRLVARGPEWGGAYGSPSPKEWFADAYALCAMQATGRPLYGARRTFGNRPVSVLSAAYGYEVAWGAHRRVCQLIWNAAGLRAPAMARRPSAVLR